MRSAGQIRSFSIAENNENRTPSPVMQGAERSLKEVEELSIEEKKEESKEISTEETIDESKPENHEPQLLQSQTKKLGNSIKDSSHHCWRKTNLQQV